MRKTILALTVLNVLLAGYLCFAWTKKTPARSPATVNAPPTAQGAAAVRSRPPPETKAGKFSWSSIASSDLRRYAANLRQAGCPEQTIKEIMLAEVNRTYGPQERALKIRPDDVAPWDKAALYDRRSGETKLRQLLEEKRTLLKELTGVDVGIDMPSRLAGRDLEKFEGAFGALPENARDQVRAIQENYWAQSDDVKQRTMGYLEPEDRQEFMRIKSERREALAKILSPVELQDYEMKTSDATPALRSRLEGANVSDEEFRKIFDFMDPLDDQYSLSRRNPDPLDKEFTAARTQAEKDLLDQIHTVLGDDRFTEYQRTRDPVYRTINQVGTEAGLPKESIVQAYEAQQQLQQESKRVLQDPSLTQEQRIQSVQEMTSRAQQAMQQLLGDKGAQILQRLPQARLAERYGLSVNAIPVITTSPAANPGGITP